MSVDVLALFESFESTLVGSTIRSSPWLFPVIESIHLVALAMIGGAVLVLDMRLVGFGLRNQPIRAVALDAQPWLLGSLAAMIATGVPLFLSESVKCYYSDAFWAKMIALAAAILFTFTVRRKVAMADEARVWRGAHVVTGLASLLLWFTVAAAGRWIGFS
jgi:hypothetical protein